MIRTILISSLIAITIAMLTAAARAESIKVEIIPVSGLPVRVDSAIVNNLEHRADFDYSVRNLTDVGVWNFEVVVFILNSKSHVLKKLNVCFDRVVENEDERCRYLPPWTSIEPQKSEDVSVVLNERVDPSFKLIMVVTEVRTDNGIWQISDRQLNGKLSEFIKGKPVNQLNVKKLNHIQLSEADKLAVIASSLETAIIRQRIPDNNLLRNKKNVVLSTDNVPPNIARKIMGINISLLTNAQIQMKADLEGDFFFLRFGEIRANGNKIFVVLTNTWATSKSSDKKYLSGGGLFLEYRQEKNRWIGRTVGGWIS